MADINLKGFIDAVNADVDKKIEEILSDADKKRKEMLEKAEDVALNEAYARIRAKVTDAKSGSKMAVSKAEQDARIQILTHRENMVKKIFSEVEKRISDFTVSEEYPEFLLRMLSGEKITSKTVVYLKPSDMKYAEIIKKAAGTDCVVTEDSGIEYGGLSLFYEESSVLVNKTIDNMLDEQKRDFGSKYKLA